MKYAFIQAHAPRYPVKRLCAVLDVSRSGYYAQAKRGVSPRVKADRVLSTHIARAHSANRGAYGTMRIWQALCQSGVVCGKHRVRRLRRALGLEVKRVKRFRLSKQLRQRQRETIVANVLEQRFAVARPNRVWAGDITCLPTARGFLFLAVVLDLFARRVVGWSMAKRMDTALTLRAMTMALDRRRPRGALLHHSDQGCQYASRSYQQVLQQHGIEPSMSRRGNCYDNACVESFFSTLKNELVHDRQYRTRDEARRDVFAYIETFYNPRRLHQSLGYVSPMTFEQRHGVP